MKKRTHEKLVKIALARPGVKAAYNELEEEFSLLSKLIEARLRAGKTQEEVADSMGTTTSVIGRLETAGGKKFHAPTLTTLKKYARAVNCSLKIELVPCNNKFFENLHHDHK